MIYLAGSFPVSVESLGGEENYVNKEFDAEKSSLSRITDNMKRLCTLNDVPEYQVIVPFGNQGKLLIGFIEKEEAVFAKCDKHGENLEFVFSAQDTKDIANTEARIMMRSENIIKSIQAERNIVQSVAIEEKIKSGDIKKYQLKIHIKKNHWMI